MRFKEKQGKWQAQDLKLESLCLIQKPFDHSQVKKSYITLKNEREKKVRGPGAETYDQMFMVLEL